MHVPSGRQPAPCGARQFAVEPHSDPAPWNTPPWAMHCASVSMWHEIVPPPVMQHAPVGAQVLVPHVVFGPWNTPPCAAHCSCVSTVHITPVGLVMQHAPV